MIGEIIQIRKKIISMILVGEMKIIQIPIKIIKKIMMVGVMNGVQTIIKKRLILMIIMKKKQKQYQEMISNKELQKHIIIIEESIMLEIQY